jgi:hypothetical protein
MSTIRMKKLFYGYSLVFIILIIFTLLLSACDTDEEAFFPIEKPSVEGDYIIFGTYYGFCAGEQCIEIFELTNDAVYEDQNDIYPDYSQPYNGNFTKLSNDKFEVIKSLADNIPSIIFSITDTIIGQPDYTDGGGVYLEYKVGATHRYWLIDQFTHNIPEELHPIVSKVNDAVANLQ